MGAISKTIRFEFETSLASLKRYDTWTFLITLFSIIMILYREFVITIILLLLILVLNAAKSYSSGQVTDYFRKKYKDKINNKINNEKH